MPGIETADSTAVPFDPFELKDVVGGTLRDPYPLLHQLCRQSPVHTGPIDLGEGTDPPDPSRPPPVTVFGFDEVVQVLRDNETYSSCVYEGVMGMVMGRTILQMDEPEHRAARALVSPSFRSKVLERWEEDLVAVVVNELIDSFIDRRPAPTWCARSRSTSRSRSSPASSGCRGRTTRASSAGPSSSPAWPPTGTGAWPPRRPCGTTSPEVMEERRAQPGDDLISELVRVEVEGEQLTDEEIYSFLRLLLPAGVETTYRATGSLLFALLNDRAQFDARLRGPVAVPAGLRGGGALGAAGDGHPAAGHPRHRAGRGGHRARAPTWPCCSGRPTGTSASTRTPTATTCSGRGAPARRLRVRRPRLPRHAPGPHGVAGGHQHPVRPPRAVHAGPGRRSRPTSRGWPSARRSPCRWCSAPR